MSGCSVFEWMASQAALIEFPERTARYNPRPPGVMQIGGATHAIFVALTKHDRRAYSKRQIVRMTGRSPKSVDWGLRFLREIGVLECFPDGRNSRYFVYRLKAEGEDKIKWRQM